MSRSLGLEADKSYCRGQIATWGRFKGREAEYGSWHLSLEPAEPGDLEGQISALFSAAISDLAAWTDISGRYGGDLFCGLFMNETNEGLSLSVGTLKALAERGLKLGLDIYDCGRD